jgi:hypothetical protein
LNLLLHLSWSVAVGVHKLYTIRNRPPPFSAHNRLFSVLSWLLFVFTAVSYLTVLAMWPLAGFRFVGPTYVLVAMGVQAASNYAFLTYSRETKFLFDKRFRRICSVLCGVGVIVWPLLWMNAVVAMLSRDKRARMLGALSVGLAFNIPTVVSAFVSITLRNQTNINFG